jgi:hypothetical protein
VLLLLADCGRRAISSIDEMARNTAVERGDFEQQMDRNT